MGRGAGFVCQATDITKMLGKGKVNRIFESWASHFTANSVEKKNKEWKHAVKSMKWLRHSIGNKHKGLAQWEKKLRRKQITSQFCCIQVGLGLVDFFKIKH